MFCSPRGWAGATTNSTKEGDETGNSEYQSVAMWVAFEKKGLKSFFLHSDEFWMHSIQLFKWTKSCINIKKDAHREK